MLRKIRYLIETSPTIIYTTYEIALGIAKQVTLFTFSTDKFNLRPVRAFDYVQNFRFDIRHKPGRLHIIPNVLSRLTTTNNDFMMKQNKGELDVLFTKFFIKSSQKLRALLLNQHTKNFFYVKLFKMIGTENGTRFFL